MEEGSLNEKANPDSNICIKMEESERKSFTPTTSGNNVHEIIQNSIECQQCDLQLETLEEFIRHMRTDHLKQNGSIESTNDFNLVVCPICNINLPFNQTARNTHIHEHFMATKTTWKCNKCKSINVSFSTLQELEEHFLKIHTNTIYRCSICLELFAQQDTLFEHIFGHIIRDQQYKCISCELEFESKNAFDFHVQNVHLPSKKILKRNTKATIAASKNKSAKKEIKDLLIGGISQNQHQSIQQWTTNQQKGIKCIVCDFKCPNEFTLDQHRLYAHCKVLKGNQCAICRDSLGGMDEFMQHCRTHSNSISDTNCVICRQSIRGELQMKMHGEYHLDDKEMHNGNEQVEENKLIECLTCKMEVDEGHYWKHLLLHLVNELSDGGIGKEQNEHTIIPCSQCGKISESTNEMNLHILEHLSELIGPSSFKQPLTEDDGNDCFKERTIPKKSNYFYR